MDVTGFRRLDDGIQTGGRGGLPGNRFGSSRLARDGLTDSQAKHQVAESSGGKLGVGKPYLAKREGEEIQIPPQIQSAGLGRACILEHATFLGSAG
jgi:hypothetical protein